MIKILIFCLILTLTSLSLKVKDDCPDGTCGDDETCCPLDAQNSSFGCCPYANADCCSDFAHCCPDGYICDLKDMQCVKQLGGGKKKKITMKSLQVPKVKDDCPDGTCSSDETCCQLENGDWGCCPYPKADCCSDHAHCCPGGYKCDLVHQQCVQESGQKRFSLKLLKLKNFQIIVNLFIY